MNRPSAGPGWASSLQKKAVTDLKVIKSILSTKKLRHRSMTNVHTFQQDISCIWHLSQFNLFYVFLIVYGKMGQIL